MGDFLTGVKLDNAPLEPGREAWGVAQGTLGVWLIPAEGVKVDTAAMCGAVGVRFTLCTQVDT